jgi:hypothetical protein
MRGRGGFLGEPTCLDSLELFLLVTELQSEAVPLLLECKKLGVKRVVILHRWEEDDVSARGQLPTVDAGQRPPYLGRLKNILVQRSHFAHEIQPWTRVKDHRTLVDLRISSSSDRILLMRSFTRRLTLSRSTWRAKPPDDHEEREEEEEWSCQRQLVRCPRSGTPNWG